MYCLPVVEGESLRSRSWQGWFLLMVTREESVPGLSLSFWGFVDHYWHSLACGNIILILPSCGIFLVSFCSLSAFPVFIWTQSFWISAPPPNLILIQRPWLTIKDPRDKDLNIFWRDTMQPFSYFNHSASRIVHLCAHEPCLMQYVTELAIDISTRP